jgi:hypothetical protein
VPTPAEVEGATSTPEQLAEQLKTTCTAKATVNFSHLLLLPSFFVVDRELFLGRTGFDAT